MVNLDITTRYGLTNEDKIRSLILEELLGSEEDYIKVLSFICQTIKSDLVKCSNQLEFEISECQIRSLLSNIEEVMAVHNKFMDVLKEVFPTNPVEPIEKVGQCFIKMQEHFRVYDLYISNFLRTQVTLAEVQSMATMQPIFEQWKTDSPLPASRYNSKNILECYLKEPLLRLSKYVVLMKELSAFTSVEHPDYNDVIRSHFIMQSIVSSIEKVLRTELYTLAYEECDKNASVWEKLELTCKQGFLTKRGGNVKNWKIRYFTLKMCDLRYYDEPSDDKALNCLDLKQCRGIVVDAESIQRPYSFGIILPDRTYHMYCLNEAEKMSWLCAISWRLFCQLSPQLKAGRSLVLLKTSSTPIDLLMVKENIQSGVNGVDTS